MTCDEIIQHYFDRAVKDIPVEWFQREDLKWYNHIYNLDKKAQAAYVISVLHSQVLNGGFHQYYINGYGAFSSLAVIHLNNMGAIRQAQILQAGIDLLKIASGYDNEFEEKIFYREIEDVLWQDDMVNNKLDELDDLYYALDKEQDIADLLCEYLNS